MNEQAGETVPTHQGHDDLISDDALQTVLDFYEAMPEGWDITSINASGRSATVTVQFIGAKGPHEQRLAAERIFKAAQALGALARNLYFERHGESWQP